VGGLSLLQKGAKAASLAKATLSRATGVAALASQDAAALAQDLHSLQLALHSATAAAAGIEANEAAVPPALPGSAERAALPLPWSAAEEGPPWRAPFSLSSAATGPAASAVGSGRRAARAPDVPRMPAMSELEGLLQDVTAAGLAGDGDDVAPVPDAGASTAEEATPTLALSLGEEEAAANDAVAIANATAPAPEGHEPPGHAFPVPEFGDFAWPDLELPGNSSGKLGGFGPELKRILTFEGGLAYSTAYLCWSLGLLALVICCFCSCCYRRRRNPQPAAAVNA